MRIVHDASELGEFMAAAAQLTELGPILIDRYLDDAIEVDVDLVADGETVFVAGIMEHIEEAGIHSGDSACSLPPHSSRPTSSTRSVVRRRSWRAPSTCAA